MSDNFNPFLDFSKKKDEELYDDINKLNQRISYYHQTNYLYVANQLMAWRNACVDEIHSRLDKKRLAKEKSISNPVVFDTFLEDVKKMPQSYDPLEAEEELKKL